ncbi:MAG: hypothetical protein ACFFDF_03830 [Candidatus Odinarchaeota archaeon]
MKTARINKWKLIIVILVGIICIRTLISIGNFLLTDENTQDQNQNYNQNKINVELETKSTSTIKPTIKSTAKPTIKPTIRKLKEYTFSNGNYVSGKHFQAGNYNVIAIKGAGNVISSNSWSGGINAIMGIQDDGFYQKKYNNIYLPINTTLKITDVTIKLKEVR